MSEIKVEKPDKAKLESLGVTSWGIWECEPKKFDWYYDSNETCYILEGQVKVRTTQGEVEINKGDLVTFPKGLKCTWNVLKKIRKHYNFS